MALALAQLRAGRSCSISLPSEKVLPDLPYNRKALGEILFPRFSACSCNTTRHLPGTLRGKKRLEGGNCLYLTFRLGHRKNSELRVTSVAIWICHSFMGERCWNTLPLCCQILLGALLQKRKNLGHAASHRLFVYLLS